jgi:hypothetical protein
MKTYTPVVLFCYNRPWHVRQTLLSLRQNTLAGKSTLIIYSDGPKNLKDRKNVSEVRRVIREKKWCCHVVIIEAKKNIGLVNSVTTGISSVIKKYGKIIVLEDDMVLSEGFLQFMNNALDKFQNVKRIGSVTGYVYPLKKYPHKPYFLIGGNCWGWGTWKRAWDLYEKDAGYLYNYILTHYLAERFDFNGYAGYLRMLKDVQQGNINSWAIRWYASLYINNLLGYHPHASMVQNIGFDGSGEHCSPSEKYWTKMINFTTVKEIPLKENELVYQQMVTFYKSIRPTIIEKIIDIIFQGSMRL